MSIQLAGTVLIYLLMLGMVYEVSIILNANSEDGEKIIIKSYNNAYYVLILGYIFVYFLIILPVITLDGHITSYLIIVNKFISLLTLVCSFYILSRKK